MEVHERIREIRKKKKLSQNKFGEKLGVSKDVISNIEYGRVEPKPLLINHLCGIFNINKEWLLTGKGEMYKVEEDIESLGEALANITQSENDQIRKIAINLTKLNDKYLDLIDKIIDELKEK